MADITREHVVPMIVLENKLFPIIKRDDLVQAEQVLIHWGDMALIAKEEDKELDRLGYRTNMPDLNNPMSRYLAAGINLIGRLSTLAPNYRVNRGGRGRLSCRNVQGLSSLDLIKAIKYHMEASITGLPVAGELLRSWQLGQDFLVSEAACRIINNR